MKQPELGKRLKEARIARKMTQSEVVGTFITRNMLSQIESGKAMPSVETLQYLAEVLGISPQSLISVPSLLSEPDQIQPDPLELLSDAKDALRNRQYRTVLSLCSDLPSALEDECFALTALASCALAEQLLTEKHDPAQQRTAAAEAVALAQSAMEISTKGLYANELIHSKAMLFFNQAAQLLLSYSEIK